MAAISQIRQRPSIFYPFPISQQSVNIQSPISQTFTANVPGTVQRIYLCKQGEENIVDFRCQTTNSPIRAQNIYESSPFSRKMFLSRWRIVKTTEWNGLIKIDN